MFISGLYNTAYQTIETRVKFSAGLDKRASRRIFEDGLIVIDSIFQLTCIRDNTKLFTTSYNVNANKQ
jgi:hypothetical protein